VKVNLSPKLRLLLIIVIGLIWVVNEYRGGDVVLSANDQVADKTPTYNDEQSTGRLEKAFREKTSDLMVEDSGKVIKLLPDDNKGSRHQRILLKLASGQTILIAHNIDLAPRINSLKKGDRLKFKGEYEWNEKGGVVHWTHHDPAKRHPGGWLEHNGRRYE